MASDELTGATEEELAEMRAEWEANDRDMAFERRFCLAKIPKQPDDYDGPDRYCQLKQVRKHGSNWLCRFHGGAGETQPEKMDPMGHMKHGMHALRDNLVKDFDRKDRAIYDWIVETYQDAYDIDPSSDPAVALDMHRLAAEVVRAERGRGFLIEEGEVKENPKYSDEGSIILDDQGNIVTEKSEHYLADMLHRQDNKITKLHKELGLTRKEQQRSASTDNAVDAIKQFSELGKQFLDRDDKEYDADDEPWKDDASD